MPTNSVLDTRTQEGPVLLQCLLGGGESLKVNLIKNPGIFIWCAVDKIYEYQTRSCGRKNKNTAASQRANTPTTNILHSISNSSKGGGRRSHHHKNSILSSWKYICQ